MKNAGAERFRRFFMAVKGPELLVCRPLNALFTLKKSARFSSMRAPLIASKKPVPVGLFVGLKAQIGLVIGEHPSE